MGRSNSHRRDVVTQELKLGRAEDTFVRVDNQAKLLNALKEFLEMMLVVL